MTKKQAAYARKAAWTAALKNHRVVKYETGTMVSYPTRDARDIAINKARKANVGWAILTQPPS